MGTDASHPYEYVAVRRCNSDPITGEKEWENFSLPALWSNYSTGGNSTRVFMVYCNVIGDTKPQKPVGGYWNVNGNRLEKSRTDSSTYTYPATASTPDYGSNIGYWMDTNEDVEDTISWMASGIFGTDGENISWSEPFRITGRDGAGYDSDDREFIYALCNVDSMEAGTHYPSSNLDEFFDAVEAAGKNGYTPSGISVKWYDRAQPISSTDRIEYCWSRWKNSANSDADWVYSDEPIIWAHWGEDGTDGDGVEYVFCLQDTQWGLNPATWAQYAEATIPDNPTAKAVYDTHDFIPNSTWFTENKTKIQTKLGADFDESDWNGLKTMFSFDVLGLGTWSDNPLPISPEHPYEYVSIRTSPEGEWGPFSFPSLWTKYYTTKFTSFAFVATTPDDDLGGITPTGGNFNTPLPGDITRTGKPTLSFTDGPEPDETTHKTEIWMTSAVVTEGSSSPLSWSSLRKMADSADFNVEWSTTDKSLSELATINNTLKTNYNFGEYLKNNGYDEDRAEQAWRTDIETEFGIRFGDTSGNAYLMATCQLKNGSWTPWKIERVKGEKGDTGTSINVSGKINYEIYSDLTSSNYNLLNAENALLNRSESFSTNPEDGDLLIVYPSVPNENGIYWGDNSMGGALYMWKYDETNDEWVDYNSNTNGEVIGSSYVSPNSHLILWDGDSWQDLGQLAGPEGPEGKSWRVLIRYANDNPDPYGEYDKVFVTNDEDIPSAKWVGILTYKEEEGVNPNDFGMDDDWQWSLFKGQDGYGYEYIFKATDKDHPTAPLVPTHVTAWETTPGVIPTGWVDEPIEPTAVNERYVWMCWRKLDHSTGKWTHFAGKPNTNPAVAKLWQVFANSITTVNEYYHASTSVNPNDLNTPVTDNTYWFADKSNCGWNKTNRYLFNVEEIVYTDGTKEVLQPHYVATWADGIMDVIDYYILDTDGESAPAMSNGATPVPITDNGGNVNKEEGIDYWTTDVSKTKINSSYRYLWNVSYKIFEDSTKNGWTTPLVIGVYGLGENGADSIYADLDNEMDAIQIDENRKVIHERVCTTNVCLYKGSSLMKITSCEVAGEEGITCIRKYIVNSTEYNSMPAGGADKVKLTFTVPADITLSSESTKMVITITNNLGDTPVTRMASYLFVGTTHPYIYSILPAQNYILEVNGTPTPDPLTISILEKVGTNMNTYTGYSSSQGFKLNVTTNDDPSTKTWLSNNPFQVSTSGLSSGDKLIFTVDVDADSNAANGFETTLDSETVYVLTRGTNGENGAGGYGQKYRYARYYTNDSSTYPGVNCDISHPGSTTPTVRFYTLLSGGSKPTKYYGPEVSTYPEMSGVDASYTYEYRIERNFVGTSASGSWSDPVLVGRYFNTDDISSAIDAEIERVADDITTAVTSNLSDTVSTVSKYQAFLDPDTGTFAGTFSSELEAGLIVATMSTVNGIVANSSGISTFSDWVNQTNGDLATANTFMSAGGTGAQLVNQVTTLSGEVGNFSTAMVSLRADMNNGFAELNNTVANGRYLTDDSGYLLMTDDSTGEWIRALTSTGADASMFSEVSDIYVSKLVSIVNELATVAETVSKGVSCVDILAFVSGSDGEMHSAGAVFQASQDGSSIAFQADNIGIHSSHFNLDKDGITLNTNGGRTSIDSNGILHANGAIINGDITADEFLAESFDNPITINSQDWGTYNIHTHMDDDEFRVSSLTMLSGAADQKQASIYITILPALSIDGLTDINTDLSNSATNINGTNYLVGVPTLCFNYNGKTYYLTPGCWETLGGSGAVVDDSNMYFYNGIPVYTEMYYVSGGNTESHTNYYIFKSSSANMYFTSGTRYEFGYSLGTLTGSDRTQAQNYLANTNSNPLVVGLVGIDVPAGYILYNSGNQLSRITEDNARSFYNLLKSGIVYEQFNLTYSAVSFGESTPVQQIPSTTGSQLNSDIRTYLSNLFNGTTNMGNWTNEFNPSSQQSLMSPLSTLNPFNGGTHSAKRFSGDIYKRIDGAYKVTYSNGSVATTNSRVGYGKCTYGIYLSYVGDNQFNTPVDLTDSNNTTHTFYIDSVYIEVTLHTYVNGGFPSSGNDREITKIENIFDTTAITNPSQNISVSIDVIGIDQSNGNETTIFKYNQ